MSSFAIGCIVGCLIGCATIAILGMGARDELARDLDRVSTDLVKAKGQLEIATGERDAAIAELSGARCRINRLDAILAESRGIIADLEKRGGDGLALIDKCLVLARLIEKGCSKTDEKP